MQGFATRKVSSGFDDPTSSLTLLLVVLVLADPVAYWRDRPAVYLCLFSFSIVWLAITARPTSHPRREASYTTIVAEQIVAVGIASLILHVVVARGKPLSTGAAPVPATS